MKFLPSRPHAEDAFDTDDIETFDPALSRLNTSDLPLDQSAVVAEQRRERAANFEAMALSSTRNIKSALITFAATLLTGGLITALARLAPDMAPTPPLALCISLLAGALGFMCHIRPSLPAWVRQIYPIYCLATLMALGGLAPEGFAFGIGLPAMMGYSLGLIAGLIWSAGTPAPRDRDLGCDADMSTSAVE